MAFSPLVTRRTAQAARANETPPIKTGIDPDRQFSLAEVATELKISYSLARSLCVRGDLGHDRYGAKYIVTGADLIAYKTGAAVRGPAPRPLPEATAAVVEDAPDDPADPAALDAGEAGLDDDGEPAPLDDGQAVIDEEAVDSVDSVDSVGL